MSEGYFNDPRVASTLTLRRVGIAPRSRYWPDGNRVLGRRPRRSLRYRIELRIESAARQLAVKSANVPAIGEKKTLAATLFSGDGVTDHRTCTLQAARLRGLSCCVISPEIPEQVADLHASRTRSWPLSAGADPLPDELYSHPAAPAGRELLAFLVTTGDLQPAEG